MIKLSNVRPTPLEEMPDGIREGSSVFGTECTFEDGRNYLITAPSGKGKSTILHILYGLRKDYTGQVSIVGKDIQDMGKEEWSDTRQRYLSIVFQDLRLFPELTALENLLLKSTLTGAVSEEELRSWAERLGVADILDKKSGVLSYGQRQRIAIIRSMCQPFAHLLLDEPFSHLDETNTALAAALIHERVKENRAGMIISSLGERYPFEYDSVLEI